mmetsp:Transcript_1882/g.4302  ORF Transcript_1882/g.4302 Transcript_1882/m.4302 type:complete len:562 (+) Transcript_1882:154-1839(+)
MAHSHPPHSSGASTSAQACVDSVTVVVDPGSWSLKYGLAGEDQPRVVAPSVVGVDNAYHLSRQHYESNKNGGRNVDNENSVDSNDNADSIADNDDSQSHRSSRGRHNNSQNSVNKVHSQSHNNGHKGSNGVGNEEGVSEQSVQQDGKLVAGRSELGAYRESLQLKDVVQDGKVVHWAGMESLLSYAETAVFGSSGGGDAEFEKQHKVQESQQQEKGDDSSNKQQQRQQQQQQQRQADRRYLLVESLDVDSQDRERLAELLFEKFGASALFASKSAPLNLYACARSSGIVLDIGGDRSSACVVVDGFVHKDSIKFSPVAGKKISEVLLDRLEANNISVYPRYTFTRKTARDGSLIISRRDAPSQLSYSRFWKLDIVDQLIHSRARAAPVDPQALARVSRPTQSNTDELIASDTLPEETDDTYELPDGTVVPRATRTARDAVEILFNTKPLGQPETNLPIQEIIVKSAQFMTNADSRRDMYANIVLAGGPTAIPGLADRVACEIAVRARGAKPRIIVSGQNARKYNAWIGGSIISTLSSLDSLWVSKAEYDEQGAKVINHKCP